VQFCIPNRFKRCTCSKLDLCIVRMSYKKTNTLVFWGKPRRPFQLRKLRALGAHRNHVWSMYDITGMYNVLMSDFAVFFQFSRHAIWALSVCRWTRDLPDVHLVASHLDTGCKIPHYRDLMVLVRCIYD